LQVAPWYQHSSEPPLWQFPSSTPSVQMPLVLQHAPTPTQLWPSHVSVEPHVVQALPPPPQFAFVLPGWQDVPLQQPLAQSNSLQ
jgi:hypothetical protein